MRILSVAYPLAPVSRDAVGGAEQILSQLDYSLTQYGHESIVIASEESVCAGTLIPAYSSAKPSTVIDDKTRCDAWRQFRVVIDRVLIEHEIDLVHFHGIDFYEYLPQTPCRRLATIHLPTAWYPNHVFKVSTCNIHVNFVSQTQKETCSAELEAPVIENGVEIPDPLPITGKRRFAVSLGRICPEKNFHTAMDAARRARTPFILAGTTFGYALHQQYFYDKIRPRLGGLCRFVGPLTRPQKRRLLARARCVLIPSLVAETSSLVAMEALSCGTPVVAYPSGALRTIVEDGRTGFLVNNEIEMADAIDRCNSIDSELCRRQARERFSAKRMVSEYLRLYEQIYRSTSVGSGRIH